MKYKGKYLANVAIDFAVTVKDHMRPFDDMKQLFEHELTPELERVIRAEFFSGETETIQVVQMLLASYCMDASARTISGG